MTNLFIPEAVQTVLMRCNTSLTSSAAVERLFSSVGLIATSRQLSIYLFMKNNIVETSKMTVEQDAQGTYNAR